MKRAFQRMAFCFLVVLLAGLCLHALAAPAATDGEVDAWMGAGQQLYLRVSDGLIRRVSIPMSDLLGFSEGELYCVTEDQRVFAIRRDGLSSRVVFQQPGEEEIAALREQVFSLREGILTLGGERVSIAAVCAAEDARFLYWVEQEGQSFTLRQRALGEAEEPAVLSLNGISVPEPLSLTATRQALTMTCADRRVLVFSAASESFSEYPAVGGETAAACVAEGQLYRYRQGEKNAWELEQSEPVSEAVQPVETQKGEDPVTTPDARTTETTVPPTQTPTPAPTATPSPTQTPTQKPTSTPKPTSDIPEGAIRRGASGSEVRRIQQRLSDLGYPVGAVDGAYGSQTQLAINLFCDAIGVREHDYITEAVRRRLFAESAPAYDPYLPLRRGDQGVSVLSMQRQLRSVGYDPGGLDGIYGARTVAAVAAFQRDYSIPLGRYETPGEYASREMLQTLYEVPLPGPYVTYEPSEPGVREVASGHGIYELNTEDGTARLISPAADDVTTLSIPATITDDGETFKVTAIAPGACEGASQLAEVTVGKNVKKIGKNAFRNCASLRLITLKTTRLTAGSVGGDAFTGVYRKVHVQCPESMLEDYRTFLPAKGMPEKAVYE